MCQPRRGECRRRQAGTRLAPYTGGTAQPAADASETAPSRGACGGGIGAAHQNASRRPLIESARATPVRRRVPKCNAVPNRNVTPECHAAPEESYMKRTETATLTISSRNYSSWSLRGWLLTRLSGIEFTTVEVPIDAAARAELLLLSPSILVPCLTHDGTRIWDTLAIGEYLHEIRPQAGLLPKERKERAHCRAISGEMHSGFSALRAALPMNLRGHFPHFRIWSRAQQDIERIVGIWHDCLAQYGGPWLFGDAFGMADAMYAPVVTRFLTYDVPLEPEIAEYCQRVLAQPDLAEWIAAAQAETEDIDELDMEF